jgi:hypothetical protein
MLELHELLHPHVVTASYAERAGGRTYMLTDYYFNNPEEVDDDEFDLVYFPAMMDQAPGNVAGGEARVLNPGKGTTRKCGINIQFNKIPVGADALTALREPDSLALQKKGATSVKRVFDDFSERHNIYRELVVSRILTLGFFYATPDGYIQEGSTGLKFDFGVGANNQGNLNGIIDLLWSNAAADIPHHFEEIDYQASLLNAEKPTEVWMHPIAKDALRQNDLFQEWAEFNQKVTDVVLQGDIIPGLWGKNWHFYDGVYRGADGVMHPYIATTGVGSCFITPPPGPWLRPVEGKTLVPNSFSIQPGYQQALNEMEEIYGRFAYAKVGHDPAQVEMYMGDKFGIFFANPNAVWQPTAV